MRKRLRWRAAGFVALLWIGAAAPAAWGQAPTEGEAPRGVPTEGAAVEGAAPLSDAGALPTAATRRFEAAERLEKLRYRHLWIAYGAIWLLVMLFIWRTHRRVEVTGREVDALKRRVEEAEAGNG